MNHRATCLLLFVTALTVANVATGDERYEYDKRFFAPTEDVVTPHIAWAKPYVRGPVRALFITPRNAMREAVEIAQRMSLDYQVLATETPDQLGLEAKDKWWKQAMAGVTTDELAERLRACLESDYDLIVIARVNWDIIPVDCQYAILKKVKAGTGLAGFVTGNTKPYLERVLARRDTDIHPGDAVLSGVPFAALPAFASTTDAGDMLKKHFRYAHFGKGRLLLLKGIRVSAFQGMVPRAEADVFDIRMVEYDYYLSLVLKALLWAARKEAPVGVAALSPDLTADRARADARRVRFELRASQPLATARLRFVLRNSDNTVLHTEEKAVSIAAGKTSVEFPFPPTPAGQCFADLWVLQDKKVAGWGSVAVLLTAQSRITSLVLAEESFRNAKPITGTVALEGVRDGMSLRCEQFDNHGRLLAVSAAPLIDNQVEAAFSLNGLDTLSILQTVSVSLMQGGEMIETTSRFVPVSDFFPDREDVRFVMWQGLRPNDYMSPYVARELYRNGIDTQYTGLSKWAFRENLWHLPYAIRFIDTKTDGYNPDRKRAKDDLVRDPCLTDPAYRAKVKETLVRRAEQAAPFSTNDFSLGDECHFVTGRHELCFSPTCIASFRQYVEGEYGGDLARLNAEYGTSYTSWDEVMPGQLEDAQNSGRYAPWVDHRCHMESVWAGIHGYGRQVIREIVPTARVGYEGSDTQIDSYRAADHYKLMKAMDLNNLYFRRYIVDAVRDFGGPGILFGGGWTGGYPSNMNEPYMRWFPWMTLFRGANSFWIWMGFGGAGGVMAPDLSLYPYFEAHCEEVREIQHGIGKLIALSSYAHDGIAILHSPPSVHVNTVTKDMPKINDAYGALCCLLEDISLQFRILASEEVKRGALKDGRIKVLLLCMAQAMSETEVAEIRTFVERGGTVIADVRPAVTNEHGTPRGGGALDDLFGVRQNAVAAFKESRVQVKAGDTLSFAGALPEYAADTSIQLAAGNALGEADGTPALIVRAAGTGQAVLLNVALAAYYDRRKSWWFGRCKAEDRQIDYVGWEGGVPLRTVMRELLGRSGIRAPVQTDPETPMCQIGRFRQGSCELVGVLPGLPRISWAYTFNEATLPPPTPARIQFRTAAHIYNVRAGRYLGNAASCETMLQPGRAELFALMPYRVDALKLDVPNSVRQGESMPLKAAVKTNGKPGLHVFRLTFLDPHGVEVRHYARNVKAANGVFAGDWAPALNDAPGVWTMVARDVISGAVARASIELTTR